MPSRAGLAATAPGTVGFDAEEIRASKRDRVDVAVRRGTKLIHPLLC